MKAKTLLINQLLKLQFLYYDNVILLFLSFAANKLITSSRERVSDNSLSIDNTVKLLARCVDMVDLKYDFILFSAEKTAHIQLYLLQLLRKAVIA